MLINTYFCLFYASMGSSDPSEYEQDENVAQVFASSKTLRIFEYWSLAPRRVDNVEPVLRDTVVVAEPVLRGTVDVAEPVLRGTVDIAEPVLRGTVDVAEPVLRGTVVVAEPVLRGTVDNAEPVLRFRRRLQRALSLSPPESEDARSHSGSVAVDTTEEEEVPQEENDCPRPPGWGTNLGYLETPGQLDVSETATYRLPMHRRVSDQVSPGIKFCSLPAYDYQSDIRTNSTQNSLGNHMERDCSQRSGGNLQSAGGCGGNEGDDGQGGGEHRG
ncbi:hypothetical protein DTO002I6_267 [Penicillium roqueforti]|nr:hypothetical protein DTO002I6_267 [Penicillium roqueforti]